MKFCGKKIAASISLGFLAFICLAPSLGAAGQGSTDEKSRGEIRKWDVTTQDFKVPQNTAAADKLREETQHRFTEGTGAYFGFISSLEPWDFLDLNIPYPNEAWKTVLPYYFGVNPPLNRAFWLEGTNSVFDDSGHLVARTYQIYEPNVGETGQTYGTAWYCMGNLSRAWENWMDEAIENEKTYFAQEDVGIKYFLTQVHLGGVVGGIRMKALLEKVHAKEISIQRTYRDERYGVFYIPPTPAELHNWVAELYVWVNMKNWGIERHQVDLLYGREYCQYFNQLWDVRPDDSLFYLEWLPKRILDLLDKEYHLTVTAEPSAGPDEYIDKDKYIRIQGPQEEDTNGDSGAKKGDEGDGESGIEGQ